MQRYAIAIAVGICVLATVAKAVSVPPVVMPTPVVAGVSPFELTLAPKDLPSEHFEAF
jgi:hypothetical protein